MGVPELTAAQNPTLAPSSNDRDIPVQLPFIANVSTRTNRRIQIFQHLLSQITSEFLTTNLHESHNTTKLSSADSYPQSTSAITTQSDTRTTSSAMAPMKTQNLNYSSNYGEAVAQKVNVLASCYIVDSVANLKGLHYCTTGVAGAEWYS